MTYFLCDGDCESHREVSRGGDAGTPYEGIDREIYLEEIESGKYGTSHVQVSCNVYWSQE